MITIRPLSDCIMYVDDEEFDKIEVFVYTDSPRRPYDVFDLYLYNSKKAIEEGKPIYNLEKESPLFLRRELWKWDKSTKQYKKLEEEEIPIGDKKEEKSINTMYLLYGSGDPLFSDELGRHLFLRLGKLSTYKSPVYHLRNKEGRRTKPLKPNDWDDED